MSAPHRQEPEGPSGTQHPGAAQPAHPGADPTQPQDGSGDSVVAAPPDPDARIQELEAEIRERDARLGRLSELVASRYDPPPPGQSNGGGQAREERQGNDPLESVYQTWHSKYDVAREDLEALVGASRRQGMQDAVLYVNQQLLLQRADDEFYKQNPDLLPMRPVINRFAGDWLQDPRKTQGRNILECLPDLAKDAREMLGKGTPAPPGSPSPSPRIESGDDPRSAHAAPGGSSGGGPAPPAPAPAPSQLDEYHSMLTRRRSSAMGGGPLAGVKT